ncbi:uncharacterized protein [Aquarana catesbeiana]|uniref:uncharacterized protein n=1 Tax=Aquarana catesbeiana TaxID=8400 RepID=UPI003CC9DDC0
MFQKALVGIFSREHRDCYDWLIAFLLDSSLVKDVRQVSIPCDYICEARHCSFAVLYHTKNRGRLNVTNVRDSLYDEELEALSRLLGRNNVIVVIDDLENASDEEKAQILEIQPSIGQYARDLYLFSSTHDKRNSPNSQKNLKEIKHIIKAHNRRMPSISFGEISIKHHFLVIFILMICGLLTFIILLVAFEIQQSTVPLTTASTWNITANTTAKM